MEFATLRYNMHLNKPGDIAVKLSESISLATRQANWDPQ